MNRSQKMLLLQYAEVEELISKTRGDSYSDNKKANYHKNLLALFEGIKQEDVGAYNEDDIREIRSYLHFIFNCLVFLRDSSLNSIPFEIVRCLNNAMKDWVNNEDFIIVTGLTKDLYAFSFFIDYARNDFFYQSIKIRFGIEFEQKLVQINLPITLCKDYISTVPLYHELGHFIEKQFDVAEYAINQLLQQNYTLDPTILKYFPYLNSPMTILDGKLNDKRLQVFYNHLMEYFCDLFAAQYIGLTSNLYINSISNNTNGAPTHPSDSNREEMVKDFLTGSGNKIIETFNEILYKLTRHNQLTIRYTDLHTDDFYNLIPLIANNDSELHGIFVYGWKVWLDDFQKFEPMLGNVSSIPGGKVYQIINNLMEKSIGNYFITNQWKSKK